MHNTARGFTFLLQKPFRFFFLLAAVFFVLGLTLSHQSADVSDYIQTSGEICNIESVEVYRHNAYVTRYNYDVFWYADGELYSKHFDKQVDKPSEGTVTLFVHPDNTDAVFADSSDMKNNSDNLWLGALICGIIGFILYIYTCATRRESSLQKTERLEDTALYCVLGFICSLFGVGYCLYSAYSSQKAGEYTGTLYSDLILVSSIIALFCVLLFIITKIRLHKIK